MKIALVYASEHGSSAEIASFMANRIGEHGVEHSLINAKDSTSLDISAYDVVILGSAIYKGLCHRDMLRFLMHHQASLMQKRVFVWVSCVRVLERDGLKYVRQYYLPPDLLALTTPSPVDVGIFAGKLSYEDLNEEDRWTFYLRYDGESLMREMDGDFRDWAAIGTWTDSVIAHLMGDV